MFLSKNSASLLSANSVKGNIHNQKLHIATFCNYHGTGKIIPSNPQRAELHSRHWSPETPSDIQIINLGYLQWEQSLHHPIAKLCATWNQHRDRGHAWHCRHGSHYSNSSRWQQPCCDLRPDLPMTAQSQEENMDQKQNWEKMSSWSTRDVPKQIHRHPVQAPSPHQHGQIWSGPSEGFHPPNPPQGW